MLTHDYCLQHKCKVLQHKLPIPNAHSLFNMPLDLRLGPLSSSSFLSINPSCQCFKDIHNYSAKLLAQRRISTTRQAICRNQKPHQHRILLPHLLLPKNPPKSKKTSLCIFPTSQCSYHLPPDPPAAPSSASFISFPCTVTILPSQKL